MPGIMPSSRGRLPRISPAMHEDKPQKSLQNLNPSHSEISPKPIKPSHSERSAKPMTPTPTKANQKGIRGLFFNVRHACCQDEQAIFKQWRKDTDLTGANWRRQLDELQKQVAIFRVQACNCTNTITQHPELDSSPPQTLMQFPFCLHFQTALLIQFPFCLQFQIVFGGGVVALSGSPKWLSG